jgi:hypothetical protein
MAGASVLRRRFNMKRPLSLHDQVSVLSVLWHFGRHLPKALFSDILAILASDSASPLKGRIVDSNLGARALGALPDALLAEVLALLPQDDFDRTLVLEAVVPRLPDALLEKALVITSGIGNDYCRARALIALAPRLPEALRREVGRNAFGLVRAFRNEQDRANALVALAPLLDHSLLPDAITEAERLSAPIDRVECLVALAQGLPGTERQTLMMRLLSEAELGGFGPVDQAALFTMLLPHLSGDERNAAADSALAAIEEIPDAKRRVWATIALAPQLSSARLATLRKETLAAVNAMTDLYERARVVAALAPHLTENEREAAAKDALTALPYTREPSQRADAAASLAPHLPRAERDAVLRDAADTAKALPDVQKRVTALAHLAPYMTEAECEAVVRDALTPFLQVPEP